MNLNRYSFIPAFSLLLCGCINEDLPKNIGIEGGDPLPSFSVVLNNGEIADNASLEGKVGVIEFFNTGCSDCQEFFPIYQALYDEFKDNPEVVIFSIAREESKASVNAYWESHSLTIPFSPQDDRIVYNLFASTGIPRIYISDRNGIVRFSYTDSDHPSLSILRSDILSLL